jgi:hypothetical protein
MVDVFSSRRGRIIWRTQAVVLAGLAVAACSTTSSGPSTSGSASSSGGYFDAFKAKPTTTLMLIESNPGGAQAKASFGKTCTTPCTMLIGESSDFTVTFTMAGHVPQTVTVHAKMGAAGWTTPASPVLDPPSLFPTLEKETPPPAAARKPPAKPRA